MNAQYDEELARLADLYATGKPLPSTVTIRGNDIATRLFLEIYRHDRRPAPFTAMKPSDGPSLTRDQPLISEVVAVLLHSADQPAEYVDVLSSFDRCDVRAERSRGYILQELAKYRSRGNQLPQTLSVGGSEVDTRRFLETFRDDKRLAPPEIAAHSLSMIEPRICEVALSLM